MSNDPPGYSTGGSLCNYPQLHFHRSYRAAVSRSTKSPAVSTSFVAHRREQELQHRGAEVRANLSCTLAPRPGVDSFVNEIWASGPVTANSRK